MPDGTVFACNSNWVNPSKFTSQSYKVKSLICFIFLELPALMMTL